MKSILFLTILAPLVFGRTPYNVDTELTVEQIKEIYELKALTEELERLGKPYENPFQSSVIVGADAVSFYVYNKEDQEGKQVTLEQAANITSLSSFNTSLKTIFITHGWNNDYQSPVIESIKAALLASEDINVISVAWDFLAITPYPAAAAAVQSVGKTVGEFIIKVSGSYDYSFSKFVLIGHSLGAHVSGFAGKETQGQVSAIVGLDPAGPLFLELFKGTRLNKGDAKYVLAIHTCAKLLGVSYRLGDADFWPNGGYEQTGCGIDVAGTCAHSRSYQYFAESIPTSNFYAQECDSFSNYQKGKCSQHPKVTMGGLNVNSAILGNYYLSTNEDSPYAQGDL